MTLFEDSWDLAKSQIGSEDRVQHLNEFSKLILNTCDEFKEFKEQVDCKEASIFMSIPSLLVYQAVTDSKVPIWNNICERFFEGVTTKKLFSHTLNAVQSDNFN